jgi:hypothetical protein
MLLNLDVGLEVRRREKRDVMKRGQLDVWQQLPNGVFF